MSDFTEICKGPTVFENYKKSLIQKLREELILKWSILRVKESMKIRAKQCYQTSQKLVEDAKIGNLSETF